LTFASNDFSLIFSRLTVNPKQYEITVRASPSADGTVSGGGKFAEGSSQTVTATPDTGHTFVHWTENGRVVSTSESYTDYPALLAIFEDAHKMPSTWKEWLKGAEQMEERAKGQGQTTERVYIDPDTFPDWCRREGVGVNREGCHKFNAVTLAAKYRNQG
jgi:hypothetical protein